MRGAKRLKELRKKYGHSQYDLAELVGLSQTSISLAETRNFHHIGTAKWEEISRLYGKPVIWIIGGRLRVQKVYQEAGCGST